MHNKKTIVSLLLLAFSLLTLQAWATGADDIKERMRQRLPAINSLKDQGIIGVDSQGYLQLRGSDQSQKGLLAAENQDRRAVYQAIANNEGAQVGLVGQRRAQQIEEIGKAGHWFQKADGTWHQK
jgi:uncharacterized protein YdbL (DUF1318 family)